MWRFFEYSTAIFFTLLRMNCSVLGIGLWRSLYFFGKDGLRWDGRWVISCIYGDALVECVGG